MGNDTSQLSEIKERESWEYCSTCSLTKLTRCEGRSPYCNTMEINEEVLAKMGRSGVPMEVIAHLRAGKSVAIEYQAPRQELPYMFFIAKDALTRGPVPEGEPEFVYADEVGALIEKLRAEHTAEHAVAAAKIIKELGLEDDLAS